MTKHLTESKYRFSLEGEEVNKLKSKRTGDLTVAINKVNGVGGVREISIAETCICVTFAPRSNERLQKQVQKVEAIINDHLL